MQILNRNLAKYIYSNEEEKTVNWQKEHRRGKRAKTDSVITVGHIMVICLLTQFNAVCIFTTVSRSLIPLRTCSSLGEGSLLILEEQI